MEQILTACVKALESADQPTRRALSHLVAQILSLTQVERVVPVAEKKSVKRDQDATNEDDNANAEVTKPLLSPAEMLSLLSFHFNKLNVSRRTRIGIFDFYASTLTLLGTQFVEAQYPVIVKHFMTEIVSPSHARPSTSLATTQYEVFLIRKLMGILLRDLIGTRLLGEQGQIEAIKELSGSYLRRWPALMPGQAAPSPNVLVIALKEVAGLLQQLGNAPPPVQVRVYSLQRSCSPITKSTYIGTGSFVRATCTTSLPSQPCSSSCRCLVSPLLLPIHSASITKSHSSSHRSPSA